MMRQMDKRTGEALAWLRFVLNPDTAMPTVTDWEALLAFADKQALVGICMPYSCAEQLERAFMIQWYGQCQQLEENNRHANERIVELFGMLEEAGFPCCLLKGQGNAAMYPAPLLRTPGDIDVWIDADEERVSRYIRQTFPDAKTKEKHFDFPIFEDIDVDAHVVPLKLYAPASGKRLRRWIEQNKADQFAHKIRLAGTDRDVSVPTGRFNVIFQLGHMLIHLLDDGVGLRQVMDYFYVLKNLNLTEQERSDLAGTIRSLGMMRFARAIMWVEHHVLGLDAGLCVVDPDEKLGRKLLADILDGGNFGYYSRPFQSSRHSLPRFLAGALRDITLLPLAPREGIARLVWKMGKSLLIQSLAKLALGIVLMGVLLFLPAGSLRYWPGWLLMGILFVPMLTAGFVLLFRNPKLLRKRLKAKEEEREQKTLVALSGLLFIAAFVVAGLNWRFRWCVLPDWAVWVAAGVFLLSYLLYAEVLRENTYLSRTIEVQKGQKVIDTGLYGVVRHPMYMATNILFLAMPLVLASPISFAIMLLYLPLIAKRIRNEEAVLEEGLPGYKEYKTRVKYKVLPFIW